MANINYSNTPASTQVRDLRKIDSPTQNIYESLAIVSKRANQIAAQMKEELHSKLQEFSNDSDTLEEVFENREQIEISRFYERLPHPTIISTNEFLESGLEARYND